MRYAIWERWLIAGLCAYESAAILTDDDSRMPTITYISAKHPAIGAALVATLAVHLYRAGKHAR